MFVPVCDRPSVAEPTEAQDRAVMETKSAAIHRKMLMPASQLPITGSAHKAANGRRPLAAATGTAPSARVRRPRVARRARGRSAAGWILPRGLHAAGRDRRHRATRTRPSVYDLLFQAAAETMLTIAADPKHLGARIGITAVLHTWGSAMTHHPHVHMIVPGGGISLDGRRWIASRPASCCRCACSASCSGGCS